jgi:GAF domain-containing protein
MVNRRAPDRLSQRVGRAATEDAGDEAVLDATRQLLGITTPAQAADVARNLITVLGGKIVPAAGAPGCDALPVDVSFGQGAPLVPLAPPLSVARLLLERHLPSFMVNAQRALARVDKLSRLAERGEAPSGSDLRARTVVLPTHFDLEAVLGGLTQNVTSLLGLSGSGVTMAGDGRLHCVTVGSYASELVRDHELQHPCLCRDVCATGEVVRVTDVRVESTRWPEFSATATGLAVAGVAAVPLMLAGQSIGSLNLYSAEPRAWSDEDIGLAELLADVATCHLVNASRHCRQGQLAEQLQEALESRIVIERAKEITSDRQGITLEQAYQRMRRHARSKHTSLRLVAEAIVAVGLRV